MGPKAASSNAGVRKGEEGWRVGAGGGVTETRKGRVSAGGMGEGVRDGDEGLKGG